MVMMVFGSGFSVYLTKLILLCGKKERSPESLYIYICYTQCIIRYVYITFALHDIASYSSLGQRERSSWLQRNLPLRPRLRRHGPKRTHLPNM